LKRSLGCVNRRRRGQPHGAILDDPEAGAPQVRKDLFLRGKTRYRPPAERLGDGCFGRVGASS
jgi:hypothetical protein